MALGDEERPVVASHVRSESVAVNNAWALRQRVNTEANPREVDKRQCRHDLDFHAPVDAQRLDRAFGHRRRAGDDVQHRSVNDRRGHEPFDDLAVNRVE